ncbi:DUF1656 domain-containing protein [Luteibacter sp.]|uniref:DUF1656 domain-containing protein n=1 Tax=Luteibacter sp. TaxID=1886636 RepID=UPI003F811EC9
MNIPLYGEFSLYGVYIPTLLAVLVAAYVVKSLVRLVLGKTHFYAWVWHPALFNLAIYVLAVAGVLALMPEVAHG